MTLQKAVPLFSVFDMPLAIQFYCQGLGFEIVNHSPEVDTQEGRFFHWAYLKRDGVELMLNTAYDSNERPMQKEPQRWAAHEDVSLYIGCEDLTRISQQLRDGGIAHDPPKLMPYGFWEFGIIDPDGYRLCFQSQDRT